MPVAKCSNLISEYVLLLGVKLYAFALIPKVLTF